MKKGFLVIFLLFFLLPLNVHATSNEDIESKLMDKFNFSEIDGMLQEIFPNEKLTFREVLIDLLNGDIKFSLELFKNIVIDQFTYELRNSRSGMIYVLLLVIIAAVFTNFSSVFKSTQVAEISFSMLYMLLITVCLGNFRILVDGVSYNIERLLEFMRLLGPVYFMAVAVSTGSASSIAFYQIILIVIYLIEFIILNCILPMIQIYLMVKIISELSPEIHLDKFAELIETIVLWVLKALLAGIVGINVIQGLLSPAIDSVKRSILIKGGAALPFIGNMVGGTSEVILGTAVLIKNGIGVVGMLICAMISIAPLAQMTITSLLYQLIAALIQPISDKRMVECVGSMGTGARMLMRVVFTTSALFLLTIAVVASTTGG